MSSDIQMLSTTVNDSQMQTEVNTQANGDGTSNDVDQETTTNNNASDEVKLEMNTSKSAEMARKPSVPYKMDSNGNYLDNEELRQQLNNNDKITKHKEALSVATEAFLANDCLKKDWKPRLYAAIGEFAPMDFYDNLKKIDDFLTDPRSPDPNKDPKDYTDEDKENAALIEKTYEAREDAIRTALSNSDKICPRFFRILSFALGGIICFLVIAFTPENFEMTKVFAIYLGCVFTVYFSHIWWFFFTSKQAFRMYSTSERVKGWDGNEDKKKKKGFKCSDLTKKPKAWIRMPITHTVLMFRFRPINSISEFSAIGGGIANQMLVIIGVIAWVVILVSLGHSMWLEKLWIQWLDDEYCDSCQSKQVNIFKGQSGVSAVFALFGAFGLIIIGTFELDPYAHVLEVMHYVGVAFGFGCPIGLTIQQFFEFREARYQKDELDPKAESHILSQLGTIVLDVLAVSFTFIWIVICNNKGQACGAKYEKAYLRGFLTEKEKKEWNMDELDMEKVDKDIRFWSLANIVTESIVLYCGSLTLCIWMWNYNDSFPVYETADPVTLSTTVDYDAWQYYHDYVAFVYKCNQTMTPQMGYC
mmetsp:Transcript_15001/g.18384  ORF Transcript_15001/g.18384 Transcript_15001/m.18384 type:complete len:587 (+) Transcript_15001:71-1831(+)